MYAKLRLELDNAEIDYKQSSNYQGIIMENVDTCYAEKLHGNQLNPYSQYLVRENNKTIWYINAITEEAYEKILLPMAKLNEVTVRQKQMTVGITSRNLELHDEKELLNEFYNENCPKYMKISFLTPTSFKSEGKYVIYPNLRLLYQSLMKKYSMASEMDMFDANILDDLEEKSEIINYRLHTRPFPLERVRINAFVGDICIKTHGPETLARYVRMLLRFGEYSGIGIKTGIGMGAMKYYREEKND